MLFALGLFLNPAECEKCILDAISFDSASLRHICHVIHVIVYVSLTVIPAQRSYRPVRQLMLPCLGRFCGLPATLTSRFYVITYFDIIKTIPRAQAPSWLPSPNLQDGIRRCVLHTISAVSCLHSRVNYFLIVLEIC